MYNDNLYPPDMYPTGFGPVLPFYNGIPGGYSEMDRDNQVNILFSTGEFSCREEVERYLYELDERNNAEQNGANHSEREI